MLRIHWHFVSFLVFAWCNDLPGYFRTHVKHSPKQNFEAGAFDHSATSPGQVSRLSHCGLMTYRCKFQKIGNY
jgi:hypothetical protein